MAEVQPIVPEHLSSDHHVQDYVRTRLASLAVDELQGSGRKENFPMRPNSYESG